MRYLLDTYPFMRLVPQSPRLGGPGLVGAVALPGGWAGAQAGAAGQGGPVPSAG